MKILLVVPPFWSVVAPSLGVSLLKSILERAGHPTEVLYLNFLFARRLGVPEFEWLTLFNSPTLLGEFVFSAPLFRQDPADVDEYLDEVFAGTDEIKMLARDFPDAPPAETVARWRREAIDFCDGEGLEAILDRDPWMVGCASTFLQNCASLALIDRVKQARPDTVTLMGGANCEGEMGEGLLASFPALDFVCQGEADHSLLALVEALADGRAGDDVPGVLSRGAPPRAPVEPLTSADLDALPYPDYEDFFGQRVTHGLEYDYRLTMEGARGCWWGQKHHCTFCGLNGANLAFRSKSPRRLLDELDSLVDRYAPRYLRMTDNIMAIGYFKAVLPELAETRRTSLFYEIKVNVKREQVRALAAARVSHVQPGIESLSDESLRLMRKGTTKLQNVQTLRWCSEYGSRVLWNILIGFPGENEDEFAELAAEAESLHHLEPPARGDVLRIDRFCPYFNDPEGFGLAPIRPKRGYRHVYPGLPAESVARLAYFFDSDILEQKDNGPGIKTVRTMAREWNKHHGRSFLFVIPRRKSLVVIDTRRCSRRWVRRLTGLRRAVYEQCDSAKSLKQLVAALGADAAPESIESALESLVRDRLMLASDGRYLCLGVEPGRQLVTDPAPDFSIPLPADGRLRRFIRSPRLSLRRGGTRWRQIKRNVRDRWTRRAVFAVVRLLGESRPGDSSQRPGERSVTGPASGPDVRPGATAAV